MLAYRISKCKFYYNPKNVSFSFGSTFLCFLINLTHSFFFWLSTLNSSNVTIAKLHRHVKNNNFIIFCCHFSIFCSVLLIVLPYVHLQRFYVFFSDSYSFTYSFLGTLKEISTFLCLTLQYMSKFILLSINIPCLTCLKPILLHYEFDLLLFIFFRFFFKTAMSPSSLAIQYTTKFMLISNLQQLL